MTKASLAPASSADHSVQTVATRVPGRAVHVSRGATTLHEAALSRPRPAAPNGGRRKTRTKRRFLEEARPGPAQANPAPGVGRGSEPGGGEERRTRRSRGLRSRHGGPSAAYP